MQDGAGADEADAGDNLRRNAGMIAGKRSGQHFGENREHGRPEADKHVGAQSGGTVLELALQADEIEADVSTANAIALDGSTASDSMSESVNLSGSAESNAHAINIVNAAGSLVANGVNVASSGNTTALSLTQANVIVQNAH